MQKPIPPVIKGIIERSKLPLPPQAQPAGRAYLLGQAPLSDLLEAMHITRR